MTPRSRAIERGSASTDAEVVGDRAKVSVERVEVADDRAKVSVELRRGRGRSSEGQRRLTPRLRANERRSASNEVRSPAIERRSASNYAEVADDRTKVAGGRAKVSVEWAEVAGDRAKVGVE
jgi:hypothetical protein